MFRKVSAGTTSRLTMIDHSESYGRHILKRLVRNLDVSQCLGCGEGDDLMIIKELNPKCRCIGVDFGDWNRDKLIDRGIEPISVNIENQMLPFENEAIDLIIANQTLEHTKEIWWINHEIFRTLKIGGHLYLGVPNVLSFHNRILGLFGNHPTSSKIISAHVRSFSKNDTFFFYREVASNFADTVNFYGSQFYPFPKIISRPLSTLFPSFAFGIFFLIRKTSKYDGEFLKWLSRNTLETNFFRG
jgi:SAM-dependent methyltransferase